MIRISLYLEIAQWGLLCALGGLLILVYRVLGHQLRQGTRTPPGPDRGSKASGFVYLRARDGTLQRFSPEGDGPALLAFVGPTCPSCEDLVVALGGAADDGRLDDVRVLLVISDPLTYLDISEAFRSTPLEIGQIVDNATLGLYRVTATPLLVAIDKGGVVTAAAPATTKDEVLLFAESTQDRGQDCPVTIGLTSERN